MLLPLTINVLQFNKFIPDILELLSKVATLDPNAVPLVIPVK